MQKSGEQVLSTIQVLYSMLKKILAQSIHHTQPKGEKNPRPRKLPNLPLPSKNDGLTLSVFVMLHVVLHVWFQEKSKWL